MTLKEKVAEMQPSEINSLVAGGVIGCPRDYPYLLDSLYEPEILGEICGESSLNCVACWNRPYIEPEVQDA